MPRKKALDEQQLTDTSYYILLAMVRPIHGYGIMQTVRGISEQSFEIGAASLYTSLKKLQDAGLIRLTDEGGSDKKVYELTDSGRDLLHKDYERRRLMVERGRKILEDIENE